MMNEEEKNKRETKPNTNEIKKSDLKWKIK